MFCMQRGKKVVFNTKTTIVLKNETVILKKSDIYRKKTTTMPILVTTKHSIQSSLFDKQARHTYVSINGHRPINKHYVRTTTRYLFGQRHSSIVFAFSRKDYRVSRTERQMRIRRFTEIGQFNKRRNYGS